MDWSRWLVPTLKPTEPLLRVGPKRDARIGMRRDGALSFEAETGCARGSNVQGTGAANPALTLL